MSRQQIKEKGFTIIEVVLVLAIAALIFLMVFIALPALQRNQRDAARKTVLGKVSSAVTTYQSNSRGSQPTNGAALKGYVDGADATGVKAATPTNAFKGTASDTLVDNDYVVTVTAYQSGMTIGAADTNVVQVVTGAKCDPTGHTAVAGSTRNAAVITVMENGLDTSNLSSSAMCEDV